MPQNLYSLTNLVTSSVMLVLLFMLLFLHVPRSREWRPFRLATRFIGLACLVLSVNSLTSFLFRVDDEGGDGGFLLPVITLFVASYQALLFTSTSIMLVDFGAVRWRRALFHLLVITGAGVAAITMFVVFEAWRHEFVVLGCVVYSCYLTFLTLFFHRQFRTALLRLEYLYDDDVRSRLRWVRTFFYGALAVGFIALVVAVFPYPNVYNIFKLLVPVYYTYVVIQLVNYVPTASFVVKTFSQGKVNVATAGGYANETPSDETVPAVPDYYATPERQTERDEVARALEEWTTQRRFTVADATVDEIVAEMGVSKPAFVAYFKYTLSTHFRTWRLELRIREAMRLLNDNPSMHVAELMIAVGYNDRSNFYKDFQQIAGVSLKTFRAESR